MVAKIQPQHKRAMRPVWMVDLYSGFRLDHVVSGLRETMQCIIYFHRENTKNNPSDVSSIEAVTLGSQFWNV